MDASLDIVDLIEHNPISRLSGTYQNKLITKVQSAFTGNEQQIFVASFYCYLNYNQRTDFLIDLDSIWKWVGFSNKAHAKTLLEKHFVVNKDYVSVSRSREQTKLTRGGHNKELLMLNVDTFKRFCLKACTKKADEIHDYYIKLEEMLHEVIQEESNELRLQLEQKDTELQNQVTTSTKEKDKLREKTILEQFPNNTQCVYYGIIDNVSSNNEPLIKFGNSNNLKERVVKHKKTYLNFRLMAAFKVENKLQIENAIKDNAVFKERHRVITINTKKYVELLGMNGITFDELNCVIKEIITGIEYSPENYIKILEENRVLKKQLLDNRVICRTDELVLLTAENTNLKMDNLKLIKKYNTIRQGKNTSTPIEPNITIVLDTDDVIENVVVSAKEVDNYGIIRNTKFQGKRIDKSKDGKYHVDDIVYNKLFGTRQEVWDGGAYKTSGELVKDDLIINTYGKLVSKKKSVLGTEVNQFELCGVNQRKET